jgi:hypothetical protein
VQGLLVVEVAVDSSVDMSVLGTATGAPSTYSPEPHTPLSEHQDKHAFDAGKDYPELVEGRVPICI